MITIINGTNREGNLSQIFVAYYSELLKKYGQEIYNISLDTLPYDILDPGVFAGKGQNSQIIALQEKVLIPSDKIFYVLPEYNGGIPGVLKLFIDVCSVYKKEETFKGKKIGMLGVAAGRAGNLRGMEHLTAIMNYLGAIVMPDRLPVSSVRALVEDGQIIDPATMDVIEKHAVSFANF